MANHKSALKRHRQSLKRRDRNRAVKKTMRTAVKEAVAVVVAKKKGAAESVKKAISELAIAARKGTIHKRTAARKASRLQKALNKSA